MTKNLERILGGEEKVFSVAGLPVLVNAETLARHVDPSRSEFLPLIDETLTDPFEVWLAFERHKGSGLFRLRSRTTKAVDTGSGKTMLLVANAARGLLEGWTLIPTGDAAYVNRQRQGILLKGRD